jgi:protease secretion system outer membrane protein
MVCAMAALALATPCAQAQTFAEALVAARSTDAAYSAKAADVRTRRLQSRQAGSAFFPSANVSYTHSGTSSNAVTLSQPLLNYDRYLQYQQSDPLALQAEAEARTAENDLATRVYKAMAEIVRNREAIRATGVQIDGLETQYKRAQRMKELGQGTVTEVSDFEVRLAVAQANRLSLRNALQAAQRNFTLITGLVPQAATLSVDRAAPSPDNRPLEELVAQVRRSEPSVVAAVQNLEIARLSSKRSWAQYLPTVTATAQRSQVTGANAVTSSRVGIALNAPLGADSYYEQQTASVTLDRARENLRAAEEAAVTELTNLVASARSLDGEVRIRQRAVEAAQQAVEGNVKSYQGGVKSNIDVMTSYQNLAEAESALVNARLSLGETALRLQLLLAETPAPPR